jgi:phosphatidylglycerol lysyltransferase
MIFRKENRNLMLQACLGMLFIGFAIFFVTHERAEIHQVKIVLSDAASRQVMAGIGLMAVFVVLQGLMYMFSFRSIGRNIPLYAAIRLFLKRNFISVFLPAGGVASLAFFTKDLESIHISRRQIHFASTIYAFTGILTVFLLAIPVLFYSALKRTVSSNQVIAFVILAAILLGIILLAVMILRQGKFYQILIRWFPRLEAVIAEMRAIRPDRLFFGLTVLTSFTIELTGIFQLAFALSALGFTVTPEIVILGYLTSVLFQIISPFLKGLGAIELALAYVMTRFGFSTVDAISVTFLYRFFEFWLPFIIGGLSFMFVRNNVVLRVIPGLLAFFLGIVNIMSVLSPAIPWRLKEVLEFLPIYAISLSNYFVFTVGLFLLAISAFLFKGLKTAWVLAMALATISFAGHLTKAIDFEEAFFALFVILALWLTRKQYNVRTDPALGQTGIIASAIAMLTVLVYGITGFYLLDKKYFNIDFTLLQSIKYTFQNFFLFHSEDLHPARPFAHDFLLSINIAGFLSMSFLLYTWIRPMVRRGSPPGEERVTALAMVSRFGRSPLDYFKCYPDKNFFFGNGAEGFLAYRTSRNYAIVLEDPVCSSDHDMRVIIAEFDGFCQESGMKPVYYRVPETSLEFYKPEGKKVMFIGQEAVLNVENFSLEGGERKSIRNSCNKARDNGFSVKVYSPPVPEAVLLKLQHVSNDWLRETGHSELVFSQGMFNAGELKHQTILAVEDNEEKIVAFLNIVPDYVPGELTYDLIRKVSDSPNGITDFLMVELFFYAKAHGFRAVNMGFAPLSGIEKGRDIPELSIRFAYEKIRSFNHYRGLREFKEKFFPEWSNRYLVFDSHYDLFSLPVVLAGVFKP